MCEGCRAAIGDKCKILSGKPIKRNCGFYETEEQYNKRNAEYYKSLRDDKFRRRRVLEYRQRCFSYNVRDNLAESARRFGVEVYE